MIIENIWALLPRTEDIPFDQSPLQGEIFLDVAARKLELLVPAEELARRAQLFHAPARHFDRGYGRLFLDHVTQADQGCDFDFLASGYR